jgi:hypothetical protein
VLDTQQLQRRDPIDRLGDPGRLLDVAVAQAAYRLRGLAGKVLRRRAVLTTTVEKLSPALTTLDDELALVFGDLDLLEQLA